MKQMLPLLFIAILFLAACSSQNAVTLDDARQIAVNRVMTDYNYTQVDGFNLTETEARSLDCAGCYAFQYRFLADERYSEYYGYTVDVVMKDDLVTSIMFNGFNDENPDSSVSSGSSLPPIVDRFDKFCENKCGDGYCNDIVCQGKDCICEENPQNCPEDC